MAVGKVINLENMQDGRGSLISLESTQNIPFAIKRVYYLYDLKNDKPRGFHAHRELEQVIICVSGSCRLVLDDSIERQEIILDDPSKAAFIPKMVWREMYNFNNCVLMIIASEHYDPADYIHTYNDFSQEVTQSA